MAAASAEAAPAVPAPACRRQPPDGCPLGSSTQNTRKSKGQDERKAPLLFRVFCVLRLVPSLARGGGSLRCEAFSLARPWARHVQGWERPVPPVAALLRRVRMLSLPSRGVRAQRAMPFAPLRTKRHPVRKREGAAAAAAAAQLRRSILPPGKASVHWLRSYERRPPVGVCL